MKIGILSMQRVINYGSFLQSYALHSILSSMGHECRFVDIEKGTQLPIHKTSTIKHNHIMKYPIKKVRKIVFAKKRFELFKNDVWTKIGIDKPVKETYVDCIVIGSDEVFNCLQPNCAWGLSLQLFGDTMVPSFSYAASFGHTEYNLLCQHNINGKISDALIKLTSISVRDAASAECVNKLIGKKPIQHVDPVLVYNWENRVQIKHHYKDYILVYAYDNRIYDPMEINGIIRFAKKYNKKIISFGMFQRWADKNVLCDPFELIEYFREADYVITDTFHGSVLSIKTNKQFATIIRSSNRNKIMDLLEHYSLEERVISNIDELESTLIKEIDYITVNQQISKDTDDSIMYLRKAIECVQS